MDNYELTPDETAIRLNQFRESLNAHGVPHAVYDEYPGEVLINLGGESTPFGGYVQCWVNFRFANAVEFHFRGGDILVIPPNRKADALAAVNDINGEEWWCIAHVDENGRVGIKSTVWLDDSSCGEPCFCLLNDMSQVLFKYRERLM